MKIEDAVKYFEGLFELKHIEYNLVGEPLRTDVDVVECYTGGIAAEGARCPALATSEEDAIRLWYEAAREYYHHRRLEGFRAHILAVGKHGWAHHPTCRLVWRVEPELECLPFKYRSSACDPHEAGYDPYVDVKFWRVRARLGIKVEWAADAQVAEERPIASDETAKRDEALLRAVGTLR